MKYNYGLNHMYVCKLAYISFVMFSSRPWEIKTQNELLEYVLSKSLKEFIKTIQLIYFFCVYKI